MIAGIPRWAVFLAVGGFLAWTTVVVLSGMGHRVGGPWDFENTGQLGDSFGVVSAIMTTAAALFTFRTLLDARAQTRLAEEEAVDRKKEAESVRDQSKRAQDEQTFFRLLDQRQAVLSHLTVWRNGNLEGADGIEALVKEIARDVALGHDLTTKYREVYQSKEDDLGRYFRFSYHLVRFAHERFGSDAYAYLRFFRAQLTGSEQAILSLNCAFGRGRGNFESYVNNYSLLHEMPDRYVDQFFLRRIFRAKAFDSNAAYAIEGAPYPRD